MLNNFSKKYPEVYFVLQFLFVFSVLYFGTEFWIGITSPGNYYNQFCDTHLNYIQWLRVSILKSASALCNLFGYKSHLLNTITIEGFNGYKINMVYSCIGYGLLSFWIAFTTTYPTKYKRKLAWLLSGLLVLWFANVVRVALLLILINKANNTASFSKHHATYNIATYIIMFILIYFFTKEKKNIEQ